jgi:hypothetical protein
MISPPPALGANEPSSGGVQLDLLRAGSPVAASGASIQ